MVFQLSLTRTVLKSVNIEYFTMLRLAEKEREGKNVVVMGFNYSNNRLVLIDMSYISSSALFVVVAAFAKSGPNVGTYPSPNDDHASIVSNGSLCPLSRCLVSVELSTHKSKAVH